jgi:glycosyltransferase involved in cell wall biosynthesis
MSLPTLIFVSPHPAGSVGLPNRPASLLAAFIDAGAFEEIIVVNRTRPSAFAAHLRRGRPILRGGLVGVRRTLASGAVLVEHPWPFGGLERRFLRGLLATSGSQSAGRIVAWVADPKSVTAVVGAGFDRNPWRVVVDAYDSWDRSPLVRGERRLRAVADGYRAAAAGANLIFANTTAMRDRLALLGARDARLLPNASPALDSRRGPIGIQPTGLVYVGRIHERFDAALASAVAAALPATTLTIAGPVEREPAGWQALAGHPNVSLPGRVESRVARELIGSAAALIVPHLVDDYTRSQDAMKAWDAIASGTAVISTPIPPAVTWPIGLAEVCADTEAFVAAARRAVGGELEAGRNDRLAFATANQWSARAAEVIAALSS